MTEDQENVASRDAKAEVAGSRRGRAWLALCAALSLHVADEALTDFLAVYNPAVRALRAKLPFLPLPTFTFETWLVMLLLAIAGLLALSPFAFRAAGWMVPLSYLFGVVMLANGALHVAGSFYLRRPMPGVYSSPLLIACAVYLLSTLRSRPSSGYAAAVK